MGFKNTRDFNVMLLGKETWRLITRPNSSVSTSSVAELGVSPNSVRRSVLEIKDSADRGV